MRYQKSLSSKSFTQLCALLCVAIVVKILSTIWTYKMSFDISYGEGAAEDWNSPKLLPISTSLRPVRTHFSDPAHYQITGDDDEWAMLIPGDGTVTLKTPKTDQVDEFTVSIYHQLRCLDIIRKNIVEVERIKHGNHDYHAVTPSTQHCINYLREMVLCRGDLDMETIVGQPKADVILYQNQCWDWEAVYNTVVQNQRETSKV